MGHIPWLSSIRDTKTLTVFPTPKLKANTVWFGAVQSAVAEFNRLSGLKSLGVTFDMSAAVTAPDPKTDAGANVQIDLGNGVLSFQVQGQTLQITQTDPNTGASVPVVFSPFGMHGKIAMPRQGGSYIRAFIFLPETPQVTTTRGDGTTTQQNRLAGPGIMQFIAMHELIHACGIDDNDHNQMGTNADAFTNLPQEAPGIFSRPQDDKMKLENNPPHPTRFAPPLDIKKRIADIIQENWK